MPRHSLLKKNNLEIAEKANKVLNIILAAIILILIRVWHLQVVQYEVRLEESRKPQHRVIIEPSKRATIRDRFNIPLAINKVKYQAAIIYAHFKAVPAFQWETLPSGRKIKKYRRKEYIKELSALLGEELQLDPERIEDLIYAKASLYYQIPFVIKDDISEQEYYRLKMLEKDWLGIHVRTMPLRYYPKGRSAGDIIGYLGAINRQEYEKILQEMQALKEFIQDLEEGREVEPPNRIASLEEAKIRLKDLEEHAYTINDAVGKTGIESIYEQDLRGFHGQKHYYADARGNFLKELPGSKNPLPGSRFILTLSSELQEYAEKLLAQNETIREIRVTHSGASKQTTVANKHPWIKGGAVVALDPNNGEVLALASFPRFDPNDFISSGNPDTAHKKSRNISRWFETENHIADIWDQKRPLEREIYDKKGDMLTDESRFLDWEFYLSRVLASDSPLLELLETHNTIGSAVELTQALSELLELTELKTPFPLLNLLYTTSHTYHDQTSEKEKKSLEILLKEKNISIEKLKEKFDPFFENLPLQYDKVLLTDLYRINTPYNPSEKLLELIKNQTLAFYRDAVCAAGILIETIKPMAKELHREIEFKQWKEREQKEYLKLKRLEEKNAKKYPKPYIDYIDEMQTRLFNELWEENKYKFLLSFLIPIELESIPQNLHPYYTHFQTWQKELSAGAHSASPWKAHYNILKQAIKDLSVEYALEYLITMRNYRQLDQPLYGHYRGLKKEKNRQLEKHLAGAFYPQYGFGCARSHAYRQSTVQGSIFKLITAYAALCQKYRTISETDPTIYDLNPFEMTDRSFKIGNQWYVGYTKDGKPIPQLYSGGRLPRSSMSNIGKVDLMRALETSSNPYFALLAKEYLKDPQDMIDAAAQFGYGNKTGIFLPYEISGKLPSDIQHNPTSLYAFTIGQGFTATPLQTAIMLSAIANGGNILQPKIIQIQAGKLPQRERQEEERFIKKFPTLIKSHVFLPPVIRKTLLTAMRKVVLRIKEENLSSLMRLYKDYPEALRAYSDLSSEFIGKTSTSESVETIDLDNDSTHIYTHVWFGGISFKKDRDSEIQIFYDEFGQPELVVIVYLKYGGFGKEAAPIAAQIVNKWREIKNKHQGIF